MMAFERQKFDRFTLLLKSLSQNSEIEMRCNAENFLLEERLPGKREDSYEEHLEYPLDEETWDECHENYVEKNIYVKSGPPETFEDVNSSNILYTVDNDQYLVRLEDISRVDYYQGETPVKMITYFRDFLSNPGKPENIDIIKGFFYKWNKTRDRRPVFAGFWGEIEDIFRDVNDSTIEKEDWANRLRDRLGLGHLVLLDGAPKPVLVFRYRVRDVLQSNRENEKRR